MKRHTTHLFALPILFAAPVALAQTQAATPPAGEAAAPSAPAEEAGPTTATAPTAHEVALQEKIDELDLKVKGLEEVTTNAQADIAKASKLKLSGYVQGRYEYHQDSVNGVAYSSSGSPTVTNTDRFLVRHGYLTVQYKGTNAEYVFQIDANNKDGLAYKDVYAAFVDTWTPLHMKLSVGQFKYPFGYELLQSDAEREMPERAIVEKFFFDGDRDRGARLQGSYKFFNFAVALVNGAVWDGSKNVAASKDPAPYSGGADANQFKDWVGRLGVDFGDIVGGLSGYYGKGLYVKPPVAATSTTPAVGAVPDSRTKYRLGADVQGYIDVPGVGGLALKGEVIYGKDTARDFHGVLADRCKTSATWGFILTAVQNIGGDFGVVARFDGKDTLDGSIADGCKEKTSAQSDRVLTVGGGFLYYASPNVKATFTYEHPSEQGSNKKDNDFAMAQLQARF